MHCRASKACRLCVSILNTLSNHREGDRHKLGGKTAILQTTLEKESSMFPVILREYHLAGWFRQRSRYARVFFPQSHLARCLALSVPSEPIHTVPEQEFRDSEVPIFQLQGAVPPSELPSARSCSRAGTGRAVVVIFLTVFSLALTFLTTRYIGVLFSTFGAGTYIPARTYTNLNHRFGDELEFCNKDIRKECYKVLDIDIFKGEVLWYRGRDKEGASPARVAEAGGLSQKSKL
ncbi:hypothetical protein F5148DRAFT_6494 [Russula earlei]|uniref:Uncharacterized protein n=1 Tax=Russula earlei TaxID=71964 RepID=A0ACC0UP82_9AGAM|nr:hypothetical protein F5148DRAFT_6494 [Russula earlei]